MPDERLRQQLATVEFPLTDERRADIRRALNAYVDSMKSAGWLPERVIVDLKRISAAAGIHGSALPTFATRASRSDLLMDLVAWSVERYYCDVKPDS